MVGDCPAFMISAYVAEHRDLAIPRRSCCPRYKSRSDVIAIARCFSAGEPDQMHVFESRRDDRKLCAMMYAPTRVS